MNSGDGQPTAAGYDDHATSPHRHYLFVTWDGAGAAIVTIRLAGQLVRRGHRVTVLGPAHLEQRLRIVGCGYIADRSMTPYNPATDYPADEHLWLREHVWVGPCVAQAREVMEVAAALKADVIIADTALSGAMVAAEASGLPNAGLYPTLYGPASKLRALPPDHPVMVYREWGLPHVNEARQLLGLAPLASSLDQMERLDRLLVLSIPDLDDAVVLAPNVRYVGPPLDEPGPAQGHSTRTLPLVLISFSTSEMNQRPLVQKVVDSLAPLPVEGLVTLGAAMADTDLHLPPHVTAALFVPHGEVLPQTAVLVTHAGHGSVMAALAHGAPLVCLPMGRDQPHVAARVAAIGAGVTLDPGATAEDIGRAIATVLADPAYRRRAAAMQAAIAAYTARNAAVGELESLGR